MAQNIKQATIVITTRDRKEELRNAVQSALSQRGNVEVLVIDDASTDGTSEMIKSEFPQVVFERAERSQGYIVQRNLGARLAGAPIIFSIDDDAVFTSPDTIVNTLAEFNHPRIGVVAIPYIDVNKSLAVNQLAPGEGVHVISNFVGTAHALRRDVFLELGGYREFFVHQREEVDYCLRMLHAGYVVGLGHCAAPIHHFESPKRSFDRMTFYGARNHILHAWYNVPMPECLVQAAGAALKSFLHTYKLGLARPTLRGLCAGLKECVKVWRHRQPVSRRVYHLDRKIKARKSIPLRELEKYLASNEAHRRTKRIEQT